MPDRDRYPLLSAGVARFGDYPLHMLVVDVVLNVPTTRRKLARVNLSPGVVDDQALEYFGYGACCLLAAAMHEQSGWDMAVAYSRHGRDTTWNHMGVVAPDGRFLDIKGLRTVRSVIDQYDADGVARVTLDYATEAKAIPAGGWHSQSVPIVVELIRYFADTLLEQALDDLEMHPSLAYKKKEVCRG